ncbi:hypothetical protein, partial [Streptomyces sp. HCCB10043]|uniref:hypothetical protein n=1 Tax=Streptomyces sp. HCCB10043 TaxID=1396518 RepID=UPI001F217A10
MRALIGLNHFGRSGGPAAGLLLRCRGRLRRRLLPPGQRHRTLEIGLACRVGRSALLLRLPLLPLLRHTGAGRTGPGL